MICKNDLIGFLKEYQCKNSEVFDLIENHLKEKVYYFGDHFKTPTDKKNIWSFIHFVCLSLFRLFHNILVNSLQNFNNDKKKRGLSSATFNYDAIISNITGYKIDRALFAPKKMRPGMRGFSLYLQSERIQFLLKFEDFNYLLSEDFREIILKYKVSY